MLCNSLSIVVIVKFTTVVVVSIDASNDNIGLSSHKEKREVQEEKSERLLVGKEEGNEKYIGSVW